MLDKRNGWLYLDVTSKNVELQKEADWKCGVTLIETIVLLCFSSTVSSGHSAS